MGKKCSICGEEALYQLKGNSDYYCTECATENFADLSLLVKVEKEAQCLKRFVDLQNENRSD